MLMETAVACVLLAALAVVCLKSFAATASQRRAIDQRHVALREASNLMERIAALPWEEIEKAKETVLSKATLPKELDDAEAALEISPSSDDPSAKRIEVVIRWKDKDNQPVEPVRLTAWRYRR